MQARERCVAIVRTFGGLLGPIYWLFVNIFVLISRTDRGFSPLKEFRVGKTACSSLEIAGMTKQLGAYCAYCNSLNLFIPERDINATRNFTYIIQAV